MTDDELAIREVVDAWHRATSTGDIATLLSLLAYDVLFLVPGQEPFGRERFEAAAREQADLNIAGNSEIEELEIAGDWAWMRTRIKVTMTPKSGEPIHRSGSTLTILRKQRDGKWVLARDANLLSPGA